METQPIVFRPRTFGMHTATALSIAVSAAMLGCQESPVAQTGDMTGMSVLFAPKHAAAAHARKELADRPKLEAKPGPSAPRVTPGSPGRSARERPAPVVATAKDEPQEHAQPLPWSIGHHIVF